MGSTRTKTIAAGFIPLILVSSLFGIYLALTPSSTTTTMNYPLTADTVNSTLGLALSLSINSTNVQSGQSINISLSVINGQPTVDNVSAASNWKVAELKNESISNYALGFGNFITSENFIIFQGYYTLANVSSAQDPLLLFQPLRSGGLVENNLYSNFSFFDFQPSSSIINITNAYPANYIEDNKTTYSVAASTSVAGSYSNIFCPHCTGPPTPFRPSVYTLVAGDEWGQLDILHFVLAAVQQPVQTVSVIGPIPPYNPGGPVIRVTLENVGATPVVSLSATLMLPSAEPFVPYSFSFEVNSSDPLLPSHSVNSTRILIGAGTEANSTYPLSISGKLSNNVLFNYTQMVMIVPPS